MGLFEWCRVVTSRDPNPKVATLQPLVVGKGYIEVMPFIVDELVVAVP